MASMTMTASFLGGSSAAKLHNATPRRSVLVVKASKDSSSSEGESMVIKNSNSNGRRELVMAVAAAAAACSIAKVALADEPKKGTPEAKKKYAPVCVTNPTARICRN